MLKETQSQSKAKLCKHLKCFMENFIHHIIKEQKYFFPKIINCRSEDIPKITPMMRFHQLSFKGTSRFQIGTDDHILVIKAIILCPYLQISKRPMILQANQNFQIQPNAALTTDTRLRLQMLRDQTTNKQVHK